MPLPFLWFSAAPLAAESCDTLQPYPGVLVLSVIEDRLAPGGSLTLEATGAPPGTTVRFVVGTSNLRDPCPAVAGGACLDLDRPRSLGHATILDDGIARLEARVPASALAQGLSIQAVTLSCDDVAVSPLIEEQVLLDPPCVFSHDDWGASCPDDDVACWRDAWFDTALPGGIRVMGVSYDSSSAVEDRLPVPPTNKKRRLHNGIVALELSLAYDAAGAMGVRAPLGEQIVPRGPWAGYSIQELAEIIRTGELDADLVSTINWVLHSFTCDPDTLPMPDVPPEDTGTSTGDTGGVFDSGLWDTDDGSGGDDGSGS
ncbi:MAG TPA: hypothetical protein ENK18_01750, partial [Deltaproteobacteria bacterium]|nr:hypothetical protein [Deltaproteobacteria bacterium]